MGCGNTVYERGKIVPHYIAQRTVGEQHVTITRITADMIEVRSYNERTKHEESITVKTVHEAMIEMQSIISAELRKQQGEGL